MKNLKQDSNAASPQRRRLLKVGIGGSAAAALPAGVMAALSVESIGDQDWVLSGQVRHGPSSEPLGGARVDVWNKECSVASIHTDEDGRFSLRIDAKQAGSEGLNGLKYWVSHVGHGSFVASLARVSVDKNALSTLHVGAAGRLVANVGISMVYA